MARPTATDGDDGRDRRDYPILEMLDRLEELLEEIDELGVTSRDEVERRIGELDAQLGDVDGEG